MHVILFYDYVDDVLERRAPFRAAHLGLLKGYEDRGELVLGGAFADPVDGAALIFRVDDPQRVRDFVEQDPYVANGLVTQWRLREYTAVIGSALEDDAPPA